MSRFSDDGEEGMPYELWESNAMRALSGKRGQQAIRDLEAALVALPERRLISGHLARAGEVCTVGALVAHRRMSAGEERAAILAELEALAPALCACGHPDVDHIDKTGRCARCADRVEKRQLERASLEKAGAFVEARWWPSRHCDKFEDSEDSDDYGLVTSQAGEAAGLTFTLAWELAYMNDERFSSSTPEDRYERVLAWTREAIIPEP